MVLCPAADAKLYNADGWPLVASAEWRPRGRQVSGRESIPEEPAEPLNWWLRLLGPELRGKDAEEGDETRKDMIRKLGRKKSIVRGTPPQVTRRKPPGIRSLLPPRGNIPTARLRQSHPHAALSAPAALVRLESSDVFDRCLSR